MGFLDDIARLADEGRRVVGGLTDEPSDGPVLELRCPCGEEQSFSLTSMRADQVLEAVTRHVNGCQEARAALERRALTR